jgi:hypothetical protein
MKCFQCNHESRPGSRFCGNCGRNFQKRAAIIGPAPAQWPHAESIDAWKRLFTQKTLAVIKVLRVLWCVSIIGLAGYWISLGHAWMIYQLAWVIPVVIVIHGIIRVTALSSPQYYSLPFSKGQGGEHRCIFCGNRGIRRRGEYKTTITYSNCSKCGQQLFVS